LLTKAAYFGANELLFGAFFESGPAEISTHSQQLVFENQQCRYFGRLVIVLNN
jgi:hypothetical protein